MIKTKYFFVYDYHLAKFLREEKQIEFITVAKNPQTGLLFTLFERNQKLSAAMNEWNTKKVV